LFRFTVTRKIALGYLLSVGFSLLALSCALHALKDQTRRAEQLVTVDFKARTLVRDLRENLLAYDNLGRQLAILRDPALDELLQHRRQTLESQWQALFGLPLTLPTELTEKVAAFRIASGTPPPPRDQDPAPPSTGALLEDLEQLAATLESRIDQDLTALGESSNRAYRQTWWLLLIGIGLSAPVALTVIFGMHRAIRSLTRATQALAAGRFDEPLDLQRDDEFGLLAREFTTMGERLAQLKQASLDANPLTHLPGNQAIERALEERVAAGRNFAHLYLDLDNFNAYNDRYGYQRGSEVIAHVGQLIREAVAEKGGKQDLVGHIGGDDYVVLTNSEQAEAIATEVIRRFDASIPGFYTPEDRARGTILAQDRYGVERVFPLLTLSIAVICSEHLEVPTTSAIGRECARIKEHLKALPGSNLLVNRRKTL
jgi:diguanylate cyclase (GGDEF)-like protein